MSVNRLFQKKNQTEWGGGGEALGEGAGWGEEVEVKNQDPWNSTWFCLDHPFSWCWKLQFFFNWMAPGNFHLFFLNDPALEILWPLKPPSPPLYLFFLGIVHFCDKCYYEMLFKVSPPPHLKKDKFLKLSLISVFCESTFWGLHISFYAG